MARQVRVIVLAGNGINCEMETAYACRLAGADQVDIVYLWDLASGKARIHAGSDRWWSLLGATSAATGPSFSTSRRSSGAETLWW